MFKIYNSELFPIEPCSKNDCEVNFVFEEALPEMLFKGQLMDQFMIVRCPSRDEHVIDIHPYIKEQRKQGHVIFDWTIMKRMGEAPNGEDNAVLMMRQYRYVGKNKGGSDD